MNIEKQIKIVKNMLLHAETQLLDYEAIAIETLLTAYEKEKGKNAKLRLQDIPLIEGELKAYKDRVNELKQELEKEKEKNKKLSDKLTEKNCKGVEEEILEEYRQIIIDKNKIIEELKKYKK